MTPREALKRIYREMNTKGYQEWWSGWDGCKGDVEAALAEPEPFCQDCIALANRSIQAELQLAAITKLAKRVQEWLDRTGEEPNVIELLRLLRALLAAIPAGEQKPRQLVPQKQK
jgi:hypothetical protein